ncbi:MAG: hypothetical protein NTW08_07340 [Gammaproteobacteria bacterium]|nr:hypothetical protein [Gammaproteobacteria bacterium]
MPAQTLIAHVQHTQSLINNLKLSPTTTVEDIRDILQGAFDSRDDSEHHKLYLQLALCLHSDKNPESTTLANACMKILNEINEKNAKKLEAKSQPFMMRMLNNYIDFLKKIGSKLTRYPTPIAIILAIIIGMPTLVTFIVSIVTVAGQLLLGLPNFLLFKLTDRFSKGGMERQLLLALDTEEGRDIHDKVSLYITTALNAHERFQAMSASDQANTKNERIQRAERGILLSQYAGFALLVFSARAIWASITADLPENNKVGSIILRGLAAIAAMIVLPLFAIYTSVKVIVEYASSIPALVLAACSALIAEICVLPFTIKDAIFGPPVVEYTAEEAEIVLDSLRHANKHTVIVPTFDDPQHQFNNPSLSLVREHMDEYEEEDVPTELPSQQQASAITGLRQRHVPAANQSNTDQARIANSVD